MNTIASISTPLGKGAISIVRMSGSKALDIAFKFFRAKNLLRQNISPRYLYYGKFNLESGVDEECLMVYFKAPFSYTGEDMVEFQIHGGVLLTQKILSACLDGGAVLAEPGEFSKRAFLNGKISLDKAEAIVGEINAETDGELRNSLKITNGRLAEQILAVQEKLKTMLAEIEVGMDYPDEVEELNLRFDIFKRLKEIGDELEKLLQNSENARFLKNGITVALVGRTNVGKSSIMNALLGSDRAIVTDIQGTTRDCITESFLFGGFKINLVDTAGIRQTDDIVESIGIEKSLEKIETADIVLFIVDGSQSLTKQDREIYEKIQKRPHIVVVNKSDIKRIAPKFDHEIEVSALKNENIEKLKQEIIQTVIDEQIDQNALVLTNERHTQILQEVLKSLSEIFEKQGVSLDILSMMIKNVWQTLGKITGNTENEDIIDLIFSKFCLGK